MKKAFVGLSVVASILAVGLATAQEPVGPGSARVAGIDLPYMKRGNPDAMSPIPFPAEVMGEKGSIWADDGPIIGGPTEWTKKLVARAATRNELGDKRYILLEVITPDTGLSLHYTNYRLRVWRNKFQKPNLDRGKVNKEVVKGLDLPKTEEEAKKGFEDDAKDPKAKDDEVEKLRKELAEAKKQLEETKKKDEAKGKMAKKAAKGKTTKKATPKGDPDGDNGIDPMQAAWDDCRQYIITQQWEPFWDSASAEARGKDIKDKLLMMKKGETYAILWERIQ